MLEGVFLAPWNEVEARLSHHGWKDFPKIQPHILTASRRQLLAEGAIVPDRTAHKVPVAGYRLPFTEGNKTQQIAKRGERRRKYRKYLSWTQNQTLCGKHAEKVAFDSLKSAASDAGLFIPPQAVGEMEQINDHRITRGPLDLYGFILNLEGTRPDMEVPLVIEVKNIHSWIYPSTRELWELLVKAAEVAMDLPVVPVLICFRYQWTAGQMAKDIGFLMCAQYCQLFNTQINESDFKIVLDEFALVIHRHDGPLEAIVDFFSGILRLSPPPSNPEADIPWYRRQYQRFQVIAPDILAHDVLAGAIEGEERRRVFHSFRARAQERADWPLVRGW